MLGVQAVMVEQELCLSTMDSKLLTIFREVNKLPILSTSLSFLDASQIIRASELNQNIRGFGISFSRGLDIDGNAYNDFAVGASNSNNTVVFR